MYARIIVRAFILAVYFQLVDGVNLQGDFVHHWRSCRVRGDGGSIPPTATIFI